MNMQYNANPELMMGAHTPNHQQGYVQQELQQAHQHHSMYSHGTGTVTSTHQYHQVTTLNGSPTNQMPMGAPPIPGYVATSASLTKKKPRKKLFDLSSTGISESVRILGNKSFAPPPRPPSNRNFNAPSQEHVESMSPLPDFDEIMHSGELMARFSLRSMLIKKWRPTFWIAYGKNQLKLLFFRNKMDYEEWISNPYLSIREQNALVKCAIDFRNDVRESGGLKGPLLKGYSLTPIKKKGYSQEGNLNHFKVEGWHSYGPSIHSAFGGKNKQEVQALRRIMVEMIHKAGYNNTPNYDSDATGSSAGVGAGYRSDGAYESGYNSGTSARSVPNMHQSFGGAQGGELVALPHGGRAPYVNHIVHGAPPSGGYQYQAAAGNAAQPMSHDVHVAPPSEGYQYQAAAGNTSQPMSHDVHVAPPSGGYQYQAAAGNTAQPMSHDVHVAPPSEVYQYQAAAGNTAHPMSHNAHVAPPSEVYQYQTATGAGNTPINSNAHVASQGVNYQYQGSQGGANWREKIKSVITGDGMKEQDTNGSAPFSQYEFARSHPQEQMRGNNQFTRSRSAGPYR